MRRSLLCFVTLLVCVASGSAAVGQVPDPGPDAARQADAQACFLRGIELSTAGDDAAAQRSFLRSIALWPRVSSFFNLALVELKLGHGRNALSALAEFEQRAEAGQHDAFLAAAGSLRARALGMTGTLVLTLSPEHAELRVDDEPFQQTRGASRSLRLDAGTHTLEARAADHAPAVLTLSIERGQTVSRTLALQKLVPALAAAALPRVDSKPVWYRRRAALLWAGGALLVAGVVTTAALLASRDDAPARPYGGSSGTVF